MMRVFYFKRRRLLTILLLLLVFSATTVLATPGGIISNVRVASAAPPPCGQNTTATNCISVGSHNFLSTELFFEPERPFVSLKESPPIWNEIEQLMDNPYGVDVNTSTAAPCSDAGGRIPGNDWMDGLNYLGSPSYCTNGTFIRRPVFGVTLPRMLVHPLNYNPAAVGNEMRLINPLYPGGTFNNTGVCYAPTATATSCTPTPSSITVSPGASRVGRGEAEIDYNEKYARDTTIACQPNAEPVPLASPSDPTTTLEDFVACGGDPGEPGYVGFGQFGPPLGLNPLTSYSTPAVPGVLSPGTAIPSTARLFAPGRTSPEAILGFIPPRNLVTGAGGLRKPSLRVPTVGGTGTNPNYLWNSAAAATGTRPDPTGADLQPSNENDYVGLFPFAGTTNANYAARKQAARLEAMRLGKSLFWDMQVGSDGVQACGSCHAHAGADNRTKNQLSPDFLGGDNSFSLHGPGDAANVNTDVVANDFPLMKLKDPEIAGDPLCKAPDGSPAPIYANVAGIQFPDGDPPSHPIGTPGSKAGDPAHFKVCDAANLVSDTNDVVSSQGVHFGLFADIPAIGSFGAPSAIGGVKSILPDLRSPVAGDNVDPIPGFAGAVVCDPTPTTTCPPGSLLSTDPLAGHQFRRVEPRNTPTIFLADVNFDNFWDGRARHDDNGGSVFGPSDPQSHVMVNNNGTIVPTRQIIKFSSLASLAKGPALSIFEMSFAGRNWAKIGKKLLQAGVTPLANQLVDPTDGILGPYSNQNGSACAALPAADRSPAGGPPTTLGTGVPGLCISYPALIRHAFYPALHNNATQHLNGCYTDGNATLHPNQCSGLAPITILDHPSGLPDVLNTTNTADPFDGYRLTPAGGAANATNTNQFTQMESNFSLFWGQSIHVWATILVPDDTPWDQWLDQNPDAHENIGETGEPLLVNDLATCGDAGSGTTPSNRRSFDPTTGRFQRGCFTPLGNFRRDPGLTACIANELVPGVGRVCTQRITAAGDRAPGSPDPLLGMDLFFGSNLSLKNPEFRSARCGECHAPPTLTDHTTPFTHKWELGDVLPEFEFGRPDIEPLLEPMGRERIISGFLLEDETNAPGQDAIERRTINMSIAPAPVSTNVNCVVDNCSGYSFPDGITINNTLDGYTIHSDIGTVTHGPLVGTTPAQNAPVPFTSFGGAFFDNGVYNLGVRPCTADQTQVIGACDDNGRGNTDPFGWPLSFAALLMKNLGGPGQQPGVPIPIAQFDPSKDEGGLFEETAQDQQINPGYSDEQVNRLLPPYLAPFPPKITVGDEQPGVDEAGSAFGAMVNTLMDVANAEGFPEFPIDPQPYIGEVINSATATVNGTLGGSGLAHMGTWPMVNRVGRFGSFKAPQLREVELTGPYFHNGGKLTLRQVVDFYTRGGDFPVTNSEHRDFLIINLNADIQANLSEEEKVALVDFLLELTDDRVALEKPPFDHPEMILPLDGTAPENTFGHDGFGVTGTCTAASQFGPGQRSCLGGMFLDVPATGAAGNPGGRIPAFLGVTNNRGTNGTSGFNCDTANGPVSQYCSIVTKGGVVTTNAVLRAARLKPKRTLPGIRVSFKLDTRLTRGEQMGDLWVSPAKYDTIQGGKTFVVQARAVVLDAKGKPAKSNVQWKSADPRIVTVSSGPGNLITITVHRAGKTTLTVTSNGPTNQTLRSNGLTLTLTITATKVDGALRVVISQ